MTEGTNFGITLGIDSRLDQVRLLRAALSGVLDHLGVVESDIIYLQLAVTEIVNNCFEHGYKWEEDKRIEVRIVFVDNLVRIHLIDNGPPFPEDQRYRLLGEVAPIEDPYEQWTMRGRGLQIVRQVVDSIELSSEDGNNRISLIKRVALRED